MILRWRLRFLWRGGVSEGYVTIGWTQGCVTRALHRCSKKHFVEMQEIIIWRRKKHKHTTSLNALDKRIANAPINSLDGVLGRVHDTLAR